MLERHPFAVEVESARKAREARDVQEALQAGELLSERNARLLKQESEIEEMLQSGKQYHTAESTVEAFSYVIRNYDTAYVNAWLADHPLDAAYLLQLKKEPGQ